MWYGEIGIHKTFYTSHANSVNKNNHVMSTTAVWIVASIGTIALIGSFIKMKGGFGPNNLRVIVIIVVAIFATLLALVKESSLTAAMGILGAIAGYVFGTSKGPSDG